MKMVFNELSYIFPQKSVNEGRYLFENFLKTYNASIKAGIDQSIIVENKFEGIMLALDYTVEKWRNDSEIDNDLKRIYRRLNDFAEFIHDDLREILQEKEFSCIAGRSNGLMIASHLDCISISFLSESVWDNNIINGILHSLLHTGELISEEINVYHTAKEDHIKANNFWLQQKISEEKFNINNGQELWYKKDGLLPSLLFCESTRRQLYKLRKGDKELKQIIKKLLILENYFSKWDGKVFDRNEINADPETEITLNSFKEEHTFTAPDGRDITFSWHIRFTGGDYEGRIFFEPDFVTKHGIIGHIGGKLPTVSWHNP